MVRQVLAAPEVLEVLGDRVTPLHLECLAILEVLGSPAARDLPLALESLVALDRLLVLGALVGRDLPLALESLVALDLLLVPGALVGRYRPLPLERPEFLEFLAVLEVPELQEVPLVLGGDQARFPTASR